ncbi:hypothetical protein ACTXT7_011205 [Hymenolepis weldensis]
MPKSKDKHSEYRDEHRRSSSKHHHRRKSHSSIHQSKRSCSPSKLSFITSGEYTANSPLEIKKNHGANLIITNGSIYAVKVEPVPIIDCIKLRRIKPVIKPDVRVRESSIKKKSMAPYLIKPVSSIKPFKEDRNAVAGNICIDTDSTLIDTSIMSDESNLTNKEEAVTTKLNDIILRMENNMAMNDQSRNSVKFNSSPNAYEFKQNLEIE